MAPRYRKVTVAIWADAKFRVLSPLKPSGQALWLYLLTARETIKIPGIIPAGKAALAESLRWHPEAFAEAFAEALTQGMVEADWSAPLVFLPNAIEHNLPESANVITGWRDQWSEIPDCPLKRKAWHRLNAFLGAFREAYGEAFREACPEPAGKVCADPSPNQEQEQEQEQETNSSAGTSPAAPPAALPVEQIPASVAAETPAPKPKTSAAPKPKADPRHAPLRAVWEDEYRARYGSPYDAWGPADAVALNKRLAVPPEVFRDKARRGLASKGWEHTATCAELCSPRHWARLAGAGPPGKRTMAEVSDWSDPVKARETL